MEGWSEADWQAILNYRPNLTEPINFTAPGEVYGMWVTASYDDVVIAHGLASHLNQRGRWDADFFGKDDVQWQYLTVSTTEEAHPSLGKKKCWDIVVDGKPILKDAAWEYVELPEAWQRFNDMMTFRAMRLGDSGFGLKATGEEDGLDIDQAWFS